MDQRCPTCGRQDAFHNVDMHLFASRRRIIVARRRSAALIDEMTHKVFPELRPLAERLVLGDRVNG